MTSYDNTIDTIQKPTQEIAHKKTTLIIWYPAKTWKWKFLTLSLSCIPLCILGCFCLPPRIEKEENGDFFQKEPLTSQTITWMRSTKNKIVPPIHHRRSLPTPPITTIPDTDPPPTTLPDANPAVALSTTPNAACCSHTSGYWWAPAGCFWCWPYSRSTPPHCSVLFPPSTSLHSNTIACLSHIVQTT